MKLNLDKVDTMYSAFIDGDTYKYGWYQSGKAVVAKNNEVLSFAEAYKTLVPKCSFNLYDAFFVSTTRYKKTLDGIVRYLIDTYNKD